MMEKKKPKKKRQRNAHIDPKFQRFSNFRQEHTDFVTMAYGHAGKAKLMDYDLEQLVISGALHTAFQTPGTIFTMDGSLVRSQLMYTGICIFTTAASYFIMDDDQAADVDGQQLDELAGYMNVFIPLILGLYISLCLARWWSLRLQGIGIVLDAAQNVPFLMAGMFPGPDWSELHDQILKWALASISLIVNTCREKESIDSLGPKGDNLFTEEELEVVKQCPHRARPVLMWCWILMVVARLCREFNMPPGKYRDVAMECVAARQGISLIWTYLRTQLPFAYVHLVTFLVNLNNLVVSVKCGIVLSMGIKSETYSVCVNQLLFLFVVPPLYQGLLGISHVIHDPFGEDLLDFPVMAFQEYTNEAAVTVTNSGYKCPALQRSYGSGPKSTGFGATKISNQASAGSYPTNKLDATGASAQPVSQIHATELSDVVQQMDQVVAGQLIGQDEIVAMLRQHVKNLEDNVTGMATKIQSLESRLDLNILDTLNR